MSTTPKDDGGAAFPTRERAIAGGYSGASDGMTLRDYFAASAMQGLLAGKWVRSTEQGFTENVDTLAACAYVAADALLSARKA